MDRHTKAARLERMLAVGRRIAAEEDTSRLLEVCLDAIVEYAGAGQGFVLLRDDEGRPRVRAAHNLDRETVRSSHFKPFRQVADYVLRTGEHFVGNAGADAIDAPAASIHERKHLVVALPLRSRETVMGVVYVDWVDDGRPAPDVEALRPMQDLGELTALCVETRRELRRLRHEVSQLRLTAQSLEAKATSLHDEVAAKSVELAHAGRVLGDRFGTSNLIGRSAAMRRVFDMIAQVADYPVQVLITGESGTGKELVARALHHGGARATQPFLAVNCAAIPEHLLESELFGYRRGAFTGAQTDKPGLFVAARAGTVFLDEVGELPLALQAKLLRVLQEREVRPVGGHDPIAIDARVVAATNIDLAHAVRQGLVREDLYYRLNVVRVELPALRSRIEDIPILAQHFLDQFCEELGLPARRFSADAMQRLMRARWPGNVRQLENGVKASAILSREPIIPAGALRGIEGLDEERRPPTASESRIRNRSQWEAHERERMIEALVRCGWNKTKAAQALGISRRNLYRKLSRHGIDGGEE